MPPKKQGATPPAPSPGPNPADPGNQNAPDNPTSAPIAGYVPPGQNTDPNTGQVIQYGTLSVSAGNISTTVTLGQNVQPTDHVMTSKPAKGGQGRSRVNADDEPVFTTVQGEIASISSWYGNATLRQQYINQMYAAGLLSSKKAPSGLDVIRAWSLLVQEASVRGDVTPDDLLAQAAKGGWNALNPTLQVSDFGNGNATGNPNNVPDSSTTTSETVYKSYLDPATIMGALADSMYRLAGRNPTPEEYDAFLRTVYGYQDEVNTGKQESTTLSPGNKITYDSNGQPVSPQGTDDGSIDPTKTTSIVSQRSIGSRGLEFLAGQAALSNPDEPNYQAATTYFNAFIKALSGPASGMQSSGPTTTVP